MKQKRKELKRHRCLQKGKNVKEKQDQAGCDVPGKVKMCRIVRQR